MRQKKELGLVQSHEEFVLVTDSLLKFKTVFLPSWQQNKGIPHQVSSSRRCFTFLSPLKMPSYYDIDEILAEEELIPCTNLFDFSHLAHLDPDLVGGMHYLPEGSQVKLPLWAMEKWAMLGFVRMSLPRHFGRKARERLEADPGQADLRYVRLVRVRFYDMCAVFHRQAHSPFLCDNPQKAK